MLTICHSNLLWFKIILLFVFFFSFLSFSVFHSRKMRYILQEASRKSFWSMFKICIFARRPTLKSISSEQPLASTKMWTQVSYVYVTAKVNERVNLCFVLFCFFLLERAGRGRVGDSSKTPIWNEKWYSLSFLSQRK